MSFFSLSKLILVAKKQRFDYVSITTPPTTAPVALLEEYSKVVVELAERYIPWMFERPMELVFRWKPMWSASSVRTRGNPFLPKRRKALTPFSRLIGYYWYLLYIYLLDETFMR